MHASSWNRFSASGNALWTEFLLFVPAQNAATVSLNLNCVLPDWWT
jgi:hypothetical protein